MNRYGEITMAVLEEIGDLALRGADGAWAVLTLGAAFPIYTVLAGKLNDIWREQDRRLDARARRKVLYQTVHRLKKGGMIMPDSRAGLLLTAIGRRFLTERGFSPGHFLPRERYPSSAIDKVVVVIFDIPEKDKRKRDWFRRVLGNMGFSLLQKSVWVGKRAISEELLRDLGAFSLLSRIHFFVIDQEGAVPLPARDGISMPP